MPKSLKTFQQDILDGYHFKNPSLLEQALTHVSVTRAKRKLNYERLEFLGDRVLGLVCADMLFEAFPRENEGKIARRHAALVQGETIAKVMKTLGVERYVKLHRDTEINTSILADVGEAVIAALYKDGGRKDGLNNAATFVRKNWMPLLEADLKPPKDNKSKIQEWAQAKGYALPVYTVTNTSGKDHKPEFEVTVKLQDHKAVATGSSKKLAERAAAKALLKQIHQ